MDKQQKQIENITEEKNNKQWQRRDEYCLRIQKALQYKGNDDHEDVWSILVDYEMEIKKELISEGMVMLTVGEYDRLKRVEAEKDRLYEIKLDLETELIEKGFTEYVGADEIEKATRKEMSKKIMNETSGDIFMVNTKEYGNIEVIPVERLQEICTNIIGGN